MSKCNRTQQWLGGSLMTMLVAACGLVPGAGPDAWVHTGRTLHALGAVQQEMPASRGLTQLASTGSDMPPSGSGGDVAKMMEMVKAMGGSDIFEDDDEDDDEDRAQAIAAMAAMQGGNDAPTASEATASATETELMAGLGGIPVKTGRVTPDELRQRLLAPPETE